MSVQEYSVQCKGYNLIGVTTVEASETRGTTALVYCLISSSLYTGTVQGWWSTPPTGLRVSGGEVHPNWSDGQQGRSQLSTAWFFSKQLKGTNKVTRWDILYCGKNPEV